MAARAKIAIRMLVVGRVFFIGQRIEPHAARLKEGGSGQWSVVRGQLLVGGPLASCNDLRGKELGKRPGLQMGSFGAGAEGKVRGEKGKARKG